MNCRTKRMTNLPVPSEDNIRTHKDAITGISPSTAPLLTTKTFNDVVVDASPNNETTTHVKCDGLISLVGGMLFAAIGTLLSHGLTFLSSFLLYGYAPSEYLTPPHWLTAYIIHPICVSASIGIGLWAFFKWGRKPSSSLTLMDPTKHRGLYLSRMLLGFCFLVMQIVIFGNIQELPSGIAIFVVTVLMLQYYYYKAARDQARIEQSDNSQTASFSYVQIV
mmetsp:Transcript_42861/g.73121  ORF Transcript_42861/g.73121 Transcript_42861/m.73121 type:complete len:221 (+) Transcript_42861:322-984(+)